MVDAAEFGDRPNQPFENRQVFPHHRHSQRLGALRLSERLNADLGGPELRHAEIVADETRGARKGRLRSRRSKGHGCDVPSLWPPDLPTLGECGVVTAVLPRDSAVGSEIPHATKLANRLSPTSTAVEVGFEPTRGLHP